MKIIENKWGKLIVLRGFVGTTSFFSLFLIANMAPMGEIFTLVSMSIVWSSLGAYVFLNETLNYRNLVAIVTCIIGVIFIQRPEFIFNHNYYYNSDSNTTNSAQSAHSEEYPYRNVALIVAFANSFLDTFVSLILR